MKKTIRKNISGLLLIASFALAVTSCKKDQQDSLKTNSNDTQSTSVLSNLNPLTLSLCAPIPDSLAVPQGNQLSLQAFARGYQIYEVKRSATDPTSFSWVNIAPLADLYARPDFTNLLIHHFAGPTWEFLKGTEKGEKVVAKKLKGVTPDPTAIQWLLLQADPTLSTPDNKVTFVQRICTVGGLAPTTGADEAHLGQLDSIPYTASYLFYTKSGL
jgi:hypothetical protein